MARRSPLNRNVAAALRSEIARGVLKPAARLTEEAIGERFNISRTTARAALAQLANEGLVDRLPGRYGGTFVRTRVTLTHVASKPWPDARRVAETDQYFTEVREQGFEPSQLLEVTTVRAPAEIADRLDLDDTTCVLRRCIRYVSGQPTSIAESYYPRWLVDEIPELGSSGNVTQGTTMLLAERGRPLVAGKDEHTARMPSPQEAALLELGPGTPVMVVVRTAYGQSGPLRITVTTYASDRNRIVHMHGDPHVLAAEDA